MSFLVTYDGNLVIKEHWQVKTGGLLNLAPCGPFSNLGRPCLEIKIKINKIKILYKLFYKYCIKRVGDIA